MSRFVQIAFLAALVALRPVPAQTTYAGITGSVTDPNGAVVPGATIEATHLQTNYQYTATSNAVGVYTLSQLREGEYRLRARAAGFQDYVAQNVQLVARDLRRLDINLRVGAVETVVEVTAGATLIETETARIGNTKSASTLASLPLNTRSLYNFLALSPGVVGAGGGQATRRFAGSRVNQSEQSIDGVTVSNGYDGTQISPLVGWIGSYEEVRVDISNNTADIGAVGQVTVISKSGTNGLHGLASDYYSTPWFRARNPFALQRGTGVNHAPGIQAGGPIVFPRLYDGRNKSFFFYSFETSRGSNVLQLLNPTVPLPEWREGDFSRLAPRTVVRDPNGNTPFANNRIPASRLNATARRIQDRFYPLPNFGDPTVLTSQNFRQQLLRPSDGVLGLPGVVEEGGLVDRAVGGDALPEGPIEELAVGELGLVGRRLEVDDVVVLEGFERAPCHMTFSCRQTGLRTDGEGQSRITSGWWGTPGRNHMIHLIH